MIERYNASKHLELIQSWAKHYGISIPSWYLPKNGWIETETMACFLYKTDSGLAYTESAISNPEASRADKLDALKRISKEIIAYVETDPDIWQLQGVSNQPLVLQAAADTGFLCRGKSDHTIITYRSNKHS